jgi:hypothetical protein
MRAAGFRPFAAGRPREPEAGVGFYSSPFLPFLAAVAVVQGVHVFEHVVQLAQVYLFGVADDDALGILGYVFQFQGTEEWLHLVFNSLYLLSLYLLVAPLRRLVPRPLPTAAFGVFLGAGVGLESWHVVEHAVIISNVIQNSGCPCPGIGDAALGISDTVLHFFYNAVAYGGLMTAFWFVMRARRQPAAIAALTA